MDLDFSEGSVPTPFYNLDNARQVAFVINTTPLFVKCNISEAMGGNFNEATSFC